MLKWARSSGGGNERVPQLRSFPRRRESSPRAVAREKHTAEESCARFACLLGPRLRGDERSVGFHAALALPLPVSSRGEGRGEGRFFDMLRLAEVPPHPARFARHPLPARGARVTQSRVCAG